MNWLRAHHGWITNLLAIAAPIVAGVVSGGVLTAPVIITAAGVLVGKLAQSPLPVPVPVAVSEALQAAAKR